MTRLKAEPAGVVESVPELHGLARRLAAQAADLYARLAARMADLGNEPARDAFASLEAGRRRHAETLERRAPPELRESPEPAARWAELSVFDDEHLDRTRLVTPYRALALAVRNAERAFSFWSYVSAHATDAVVVAEAEELALDELAHARTLRAARRRAYHAGQEHRIEPRSGRLRTATAPEFRREAARREAELAALHRKIAQAFQRVGRPEAALLFRLAAEEAASARALVSDSEPYADADPEGMPDDPRAVLDLAAARLETAAEFYLDVAENSADESVVAEAQRLSAAAVRRLGSLDRPENADGALGGEPWPERQ